MLGGMYRSHSQQGTCMGFAIKYKTRTWHITDSTTKSCITIHLPIPIYFKLIPICVCASILFVLCLMRSLHFLCFFFTKRKFFQDEEKALIVLWVLVKLLVTWGCCSWLETVTPVRVPSLEYRFSSPFLHPSKLSSFQAQAACSFLHGHAQTFSQSWEALKQLC